MSHKRSLNLFASCLIVMSYLVSEAVAVESSELATNILRDAKYQAWHLCVGRW